MRVRVLVFAAVLVAGCQKKLEGPAPAVSGVAPAAVCQEQLDTTVEVSGSGFSPLATDALTDQHQLNIPKLTLTRSQDIDGAGASGPAVPLPDDPEDPSSSLVRWYSQEKMSFRITPALGLQTGLYDLEVENLNGGKSALAGALLAVPPPSVTTLNQELACADQASSITLSGDFFIQSASEKPTASFGGEAFQPSSLADCRNLPGSAGLQACKSLTVELPEGSLEPGAHAVSVQNPAPVACRTTSGPTLYVFSKPVITSVQPLAICTDAENQQLELSGTGFLTIDGAAPTVQIGTESFTPTAGGCEGVSGPAATVQQCSTLTVTVPANTFQPGKYQVSVTNPAPVDCSSSDPFELTVSAPPTIASIAPTTVCSGGSVITLTGTNFAAGAKVTMNGLEAERVTVSSSTTAVAEFSGGIPVGGPYAVTLANADGCSVTSSATVSVIPGPQIFFVDPNIVYNGITVQATLYGTGFTGAVQSVTMTPSAGGSASNLTFTYDAARPNQVQVLIPSGTAPGSYDLELNDTTSCSARLLNALTVVDQVTLTLDQPPMVPEFGWAGESTPVTVTGSGFLSAPRLYLNPNPAGATTVASAVGAVAFLDATKLTALVPTPVLPVGEYDLIVVNPDGKVGFAQKAFRVTQLAPPTIESLSPGSVASTNPQSFDILGKDFRQPEVALQCVDGTGALLAAQPAATITGTPTATKITVSFNPSTAVACVVRVTNGDNGTYADFSALVITNPAQNLYPAEAGPDLSVARRSPVALPGNATSAARYLHVLGGDDGSGGTAFDSVESSALGLFGDMRDFFTQRTKLAEPRAFAAGAQIGRFLYVVGGSSGGTAKDTVERAVVLDPDQRGEIVDLLLEVVRSGGLGKGVWYYRVAAVMNAGDPFNPGGENLASDPFPVQLPDLVDTGFHVTVTWKAVPNAAKYRVYRSMIAGAAVGTEQVIAEVNAPTTSFKDTGVTTAIFTDNPLPIGSLGSWQVLTAKLSVAREGPGVSWGMDPSDSTKAYLYVFGGRQNGTTALASYEFLPITLGMGGTQTAAASFTPGANALSAARWQVGASRATHELSSRIPEGTTYLYVLSGLPASGATPVSNNEAAKITAGGQLDAWVSVGPPLGRAGYVTLVAGNFVFAFGGNNASPESTISSGEICGAGVLACGAPSAQTPPRVVNWNTGQNLREGRYLMGGALSGASIYIVGGVVTAPSTPTQSTEYRLW